MEIKIRDMTFNDIEAIMNFFTELKGEDAGVSFTEVTLSEELENWLKDTKMYIYVAEYNNNILGVFKAKRGGESKEHSCFLTAAVNKKYRGYKIGQQLTHYGLKALKNEGIKIARAYIYSDNITSVSTILKCGFTPSGCVHMHHYDEKTNKYIDDLIFHKIL